MLRQGRHGTILQRGKGSITICSLYVSVYMFFSSVLSLSVLQSIHTLTTGIYIAELYIIIVFNTLVVHSISFNSLGKEITAKPYDVSWFDNEIEDNTKLGKIAQYLRDRYGCKKFSEQEMQKGQWLDQWCELYPNPTRTVLYQALIYVGEHAAARSLLTSHPQGAHTLYVCNL